MSFHMRKTYRTGTFLHMKFSFHMWNRNVFTYESPISHVKRLVFETCISHRRRRIHIWNIHFTYGIETTAIWNVIFICEIEWEIFVRDHKLAIMNAILLAWNSRRQWPKNLNLINGISDNWYRSEKVYFQSLPLAFGRSLAFNEKKGNRGQ